MSNNSIELKFVPLGGGIYNVELRGGIAGKQSTVTINTNTPAFDPDRYRRYQTACRQLYDRTRLGASSVNVFTSEDLTKNRQELKTSATGVIDTLDRWTQSPEFAEIAKEIEEQAKRSENLEVTISTDCLDLRRQPWHTSSLFPSNTEVIFSGINAKPIDRTTQPHPEKIRILVILGHDKGISEGIKKDKQAIEKYCKAEDAEPKFLTQPTKAELTAALADPDGWDIIFFSGHSDTDEKNVGRIEINATESLSMKELEQVLAPAIAKRVQIAIFNSCDGLGIAPVLEKLNIDRLIVMREPIPDEVAQRFLKNFLRAFTRGARFDDAVKVARQQLVELEDTYPYVTWLPIVIQNRLVPSPTWQSLGKIRSPYKGLEAFTEADAGKFYGREETIERYAKLVATTRLVPIIGASGSGKSSLVQAGLIPYLKQDTASDWQILTMRPGRNPFDALAKAIFNAEQADLQTIQLDVDLASDRQLLTQKLAQIRIPQRRILLFIDQFEELFTQSDNEAARQVFLQSLADAVSNAPNFVLVFTLRNDFLPTLQSDRQDNDFRQVLERYSPQLVGSMSRDRLEAAITKPVEKLGVEFEGGLVDRLIEDVGTADGSLPLLQLVLDLLWKNVQKRQLTHECYNAIGGKDGMKTVLIKLADDVYDRFVKQGKVKEFKQVFLRLVTIGNGYTPNTRRIATRAEIESSGDNWREIVLPLSKERLLKTNLDKNTGVEIVEVIHETLIQSWQRLEYWVEKHYQELEQIAEIDAAAIKWDRSNKIEQYLWEKQHLKDAIKFTNKRDLLFIAKPLTDSFLKASKTNQRWYKALYWVCGIFFVSLIAFIFVEVYRRDSEIKMVQKIDKKQCNPQLSAAISKLLDARLTTDRSTGFLEEIDLKSRDLRCLNNLGNANFSFVNFRGVNFRGVNLKGVNFFGADLRDADLRDADLRDANLKYSDLKHANLERANLERTNLERACRYISPNDLKLAKNWGKAKYDLECRKDLGL
jgi:hypothetical protein